MTRPKDIAPLHRAPTAHDFFTPLETRELHMIAAEAKRRFGSRAYCEVDFQRARVIVVGIELDENPRSLPPWQRNRKVISQGWTWGEIFGGLPKYGAL